MRWSRWLWSPVASEGALEFVPPERLVLAPDCGMKYLPRAVAFGKLQALVAGARMVRAELEGVSGL